MKKPILFVGMAALLFAGACQSGFETGEGGLQYRIVKDAGTDPAVAGDILAVGMIITTDRDSVLNSTYEMGVPQLIHIAPDTIPGLYPGDYNSMFTHLGEGDSAIFRLDMDTMAARTGQPKLDFADKYVTFNVKVFKHFKAEGLTDSVLNAQIMEFYEEEKTKLRTAEVVKIEKYVSDNKLDPQTTASGLKYVITEEGTGEKPAPGDTVLVNYTGKLTNGHIFDTSVKEVADTQEGLYNPMRPYEPARITVGVGMVIAGWDEGLQLFPNGTKGTFIIPSDLGYGEQGEMRAKIPPFAPLIFDIEIVDIIKPAPTPAGE